MNASAYLTTLVQVLTIDKMKRYLRFFKKTEKLLTDSFLRYLHEEKVFILEHIYKYWLVYFRSWGWIWQNVKRVVYTSGKEWVGFGDRDK